MNADSNVILAADAFTDLLFVIVSAACLPVLVMAAFTAVRYFTKVR